MEHHERVPFAFNGKTLNTAHCVLCSFTRLCGGNHYEAWQVGVFRITGFVSTGYRWFPAHKRPVRHSFGVSLNKLLNKQMSCLWSETPWHYYPKKYAHGFCFAVLCCGYTLTDFPISIRLTSLALWQSNDCPSASKATLMNMDKYFMWIHYERLHNHSKAKHNKTVCIFLGIYCMWRECNDMNGNVGTLLPTSLYQLYGHESNRMCVHCSETYIIFGNWF